MFSILLFVFAYYLKCTVFATFDEQKFQNKEDLTNFNSKLK